MKTTSSLRQLLNALRDLAAEFAYGIDAGSAIRHGQPQPPPPRTSRDAAVAAYFEGREVRWGLVYEAAIAAAEGPCARLLAVFDALQTAVEQPRLRNITFADTGLAQGPVARRAVDRHFCLLRQRLFELAQATGACDPRTLADAIGRLSRGAAGSAGGVEAVHAIEVARAVAREHVDAATAWAETVRDQRGRDQNSSLPPARSG